jgi:hypothetical protein
VLDNRRPAGVLIAGYFGFVCALAHLAREMLNQFSGVVMELEPNKPEDPYALESDNPIGNVIRVPALPLISP